MRSGSGAATRSHSAAATLIPNSTPATKEQIRESSLRRISLHSELSRPNDDFTTTKFRKGNANRYYRAGQAGAYIQDKFQMRPNLSLTAGLRFGGCGLTEKDGRIFNFGPSLLLRRLDRYHLERFHHRRQQRLSHEGRQQFSTHRTPVRTRSATRRRSGREVQRQSRRPRRVGMLRPRRVVLYLPGLRRGRH